VVNRMEDVVATVEHRPSEVCSVCGGTILWKRWLNRSWHELKYCGVVCRRKAVAMKRTEVNASTVGFRGFALVHNVDAVM
jgi:hypothetical protein